MSGSEEKVVYLQMKAGWEKRGRKEREDRRGEREEGRREKLKGERKGGYEF